MPGGPTQPRSGSAPGPHRQWLTVLVVTAGGAAGTVVRASVAGILPDRPGHWPSGTFLVNLVGAFVLGLLLETLVRGGPDVGWRRRARLLGGTGFCGALTTYSTFAVEINRLAAAGAPLLAAAYLGASVVGGLLAAAAGVVLAGGRSRRQWARLPIDPDLPTVENRAPDRGER